LVHDGVGIEYSQSQFDFFEMVFSVVGAEHNGCPGCSRRSNTYRLPEEGTFKARSRKVEQLVYMGHRKRYLLGGVYLQHPLLRQKLEQVIGFYADVLVVPNCVKVCEQSDVAANNALQIEQLLIAEAEAVGLRLSVAVSTFSALGCLGLALQALISTMLARQACLEVASNTSTVELHNT
jgi:hypothetical protein